MGDDRAREGLDHLQAAALEVIAAARAFLDVAEELVQDPAVARTVAQAASSAARTAGAAARRTSGDRGRREGHGEPGHPDGENGGGVRRIPVT